MLPVSHLNQQSFRRFSADPLTGDSSDGMLGPGSSRAALGNITSSFPSFMCSSAASTSCSNRSRIVSTFGMLSMLPLFLLRWLGVVIVKRIPGVLGDSRDFGEQGPDDIEREDLVLNLGNCGGFDVTRVDLRPICPSSTHSSCFCCLLRLIVVRTTAITPMLNKKIAVMPMARPPGFPTMIALCRSDSIRGFERLEKCYIQALLVNEMLELKV